MRRTVGFRGTFLVLAIAAFAAATFATAPPPRRALEQERLASPSSSTLPAERVRPVAELLVSALGTLDEEVPASPFEPPGPPEGRPPQAPPGRNDPPNPPGKPPDRPPLLR